MGCTAIKSASGTVADTDSRSNESKQVDLTTIKSDNFIDAVVSDPFSTPNTTISSRSNNSNIRATDEPESNHLYVTSSSSNNYNEESGTVDILQGVLFSTPEIVRSTKGVVPLEQIERHDHPTTTSTPTSLDSIVFQGVFANQVLMCRDEFFSTFTGKKTYRWREVKITAIEGADNSRVRVHFIDWADCFDIWLDLYLDWFNLAPLGLLSKAECYNGVPLSDSQQDIITQFLFLGGLQQDVVTHQSRSYYAKEQGFTSSSSSSLSTGVGSVGIQLSSTSTSQTVGVQDTQQLGGYLPLANQVVLPHSAPFLPPSFPEVVAVPTTTTTGILTNQ
eukprot:gene25648-33491_t